MKKLLLLVAVALMLVLSIAVVPAMAADPTQLALPGHFSYMGSPVHSYTTASGHAVHYIDQGKKSWRVAVLIGGAGTSVQAYELTSFARDLQFKLHIRVICVERNGFGMTKFEPADASGKVILAPSGAYSADAASLAAADPVQTRIMYAHDVLEVLDHLGVSHFSIIAISGGGPFCGELASEAAARVRSIHLAVAEYKSTDSPYYPGQLADVRTWIIDPMWWWDMHGTMADWIPGWQERAYDEAAFSFFVQGEDADPHAAAMDYTIFQQTPAVVSGVKAPVFTYYGMKDKTVPPVQRDQWVGAFSSSRKITERNYTDGVHDVQYRHWDQILLDVAGYGKYLIIGYKGQTRVIPQSRWTWYEKHHAVLGMDAWATAKPQAD